MDPNNRIQLMIELDLLPDNVQDSHAILEKVLRWVNIRDDTTVERVRIGIDAPCQPPSDNRIHLPGGFLSHKCAPGKREAATSTREVFEVVQAGDPFSLVHKTGDIQVLVDSLIEHTTPLNTFPNGVVIPANSGLEQSLREAEAYLLQACCMFLQTECLEVEFSLCCVMKLLRSGYSTDLKPTSIMDILFSDLEQKDPDHGGVSAYNTFLSYGPRISEQAIDSCIHRLKTMNLYSLSKIVHDMEENPALVLPFQN